jgi:dephospho-CoA kinase
MSVPKQVGVTGGIGSGKSVICRIFNTLGVPVYDSDSRAKILMTTDGILTEQIRKEFGTLAFFPDGTLNRKFLSEQVFQDDGKRKALDRLVHPRVASDYSNWVNTQSFAYVVKEAALLIETGSYKSLDSTIVVIAPDELRIQRVLERDSDRTEQMIKDIINSQMPQDQKASKADFVVVNDGKVAILPQVLTLHRQFLS